MPKRKLCADYLADLDARGFKSSSVARRLSSMRHLFRFLLSERIRSDDPAAILSGPKRGRGLPKVLSISDVDRMLTRAKELAQAPEASAPQRLRAMRLYCLLEVLYATGLRVSELVALPLSASRRDARMIVVRGKGDKERLVPLNEPSRQAMADYLEAMEALKQDKKKNAAASKWLFPSFGESGHLTRQHFARDLKELAASAGLAPRLVSARMCCATRSPVICCTTAPTCASCRRCSATPISRPRRSTPMWSRSGSRAWSATCIRWREK